MVAIQKSKFEVLVITEIIIQLSRNHLVYLLVFDEQLKSITLNEDRFSSF